MNKNIEILKFNISFFNFIKDFKLILPNITNG